MQITDWSERIFTTSVTGDTKPARINLKINYKQSATATAVSSVQMTFLNDRRMQLGKRNGSIVVCRRGADVCLIVLQDFMVDIQTF